jgi:F-type H+-transporting ATPase subunit b
VLAPPNLSLLLIMACFWLVYLLVSTQLLKPLGGLLDKRESELRDSHEGLASAQEAFEVTVERCENELTQAAGEGQKQRLALRAAGEAARRAKLEQARTQAMERLATLNAQLRETTESAQVELRQRARELAHDLAERLIGRRIA